MGLGPSVVLCRSQVDTQLIVLLNRLTNLYYGKKKVKKNEPSLLLEMKVSQSEKLGKL